MQQILDNFQPQIIGHCKITDLDSNEVLVDKANSINYESMSLALALSLAGRPSGSIAQMVFGNGASTINSVGSISYLAPNITTLNAKLYNQTYAKYVNDLSPMDNDPLLNYIRVNHVTGVTYSDLTVTCVLDYNEPSDQAAFDDAVDVNGTYIFDEIGLRTYDPASLAQGMLLSHVIFHPVQKSLNRRIEIFYTVRVLMT